MRKALASSCPMPAWCMSAVRTSPARPLAPITRVRVRDEAEGEVLADLLSSDSADLTPDAPVRVRLRGDVTDVVLL